MLDQMEKDGKAIRQEALKMSWYMRGGLTYISELIKENLETTKKSGLPFF